MGYNNLFLNLIFCYAIILKIPPIYVG